jgi:carbon storage regulator CsrA
MLVLSRKADQQIQIGDSITITILVIKGNTVRVGIEAPREVRVLRAELPPRAATTRPATSAASPRVTQPAPPAGQRTASPPEFSSPRQGSTDRVTQADGPLSRMRRRAPGACDAALVRLPQRLGPASLRGLVSRRF